MAADKSQLDGKRILAVDDEVDVTDTIVEVLDMCLVRKANDYETARQLLMSYTFDIVILDIMGVRGFELLKKSVSSSSVRTASLTMPMRHRKAPWNRSPH